jgi:hypothetical protein
LRSTGFLAVAPSIWCARCRVSESIALTDVLACMAWRERAHASSRQWALISSSGRGRKQSSASTHSVLAGAWKRIYRDRAVHGPAGASLRVAGEHSTGRRERSTT